MQVLSLVESAEMDLTALPDRTRMLRLQRVILSYFIYIIIYNNDTTKYSAACTLRLPLFGRRRTTGRRPRSPRPPAAPWSHLT